MRQGSAAVLCGPKPVGLRIVVPVVLQLEIYLPVWAAAVAAVESVVAAVVSVLALRWPVLPVGVW